jgi:hypothetical protein
MDVYGTATYGTSVSYAALVVYTSKLVAGPDDREVTSVTQVYIPSSSASVAEHDRLTLPDGTQPRVIKVDRYADDNGQHNTVIWCG